MAFEMQTAAAGEIGIEHAARAIDRRHRDLNEDAAFAAMRAAYQPVGGLARGDDLARLLEDRACGDFVSLARLIVDGEVFAFEWRRTYWIPMFQFDLADLSIKRGLRQVLLELGGRFDGWRLAAWFVEPNEWLGCERPVDLMDSNLPEVVQAARADRFVAAG